MKNLLLATMLFLNIAGTPAEAAAHTYTPKNPIEKINKSLSSIERSVRNAAVKVVAPGGGHGSGSLVKYKDLTLVFTARHVAQHALGTNYLISKNNENVMAKLMYQSATADIAILILTESFKDHSVKPMSWAPSKTYDVGKTIVYSGFPSSHQLMSFDGRIAGYEVDSLGNAHLIVNTYGWFGCSGSVMYDEKGKIIGILYGVDIEYYPGIQINENMIWVAPIKNIDIKDAIKPLCRGQVHNYRACQ